MVAHRALAIVANTTKGSHGLDVRGVTAFLIRAFLSTAAPVQSSISTYNIRQYGNLQIYP